MAHRGLLLASLLALPLLSGCEGLTTMLVGGPDTSPDALDPSQAGNKQWGPELPSPSSRTPRLSHAEYRNTLSDLLKLPLQQISQLTSFLIGDPQTSLFANSGELTVTSPLWQDYQRVAEELSSIAVPDTAALAKLAGGSASTGKAFIEGFGRRAYRRPLTAAEVSAFEQLFAQGPQLIPGTPALVAGARLVVEAVLQSPHFLYRVESSTQADGSTVPLSGYELASRLSYGLWQTMPDDALFAAAESGDLLRGEGLGTQVDRLLSDPRARATVAHFHALLLDSAKYTDLSRSTNLFPEWNNALRVSMAEEQKRFIEHVIFEEKAGLKALFTAQYSFVDSHLAAVYKVQAPNAGFVKVAFPDGRRAGLLTQIGFLTANASSTQSDPIHRGVFVNARMLCRNLPPPPNDVPPLPAEDPNVKRTMRQRVDLFTGPGTCGASCHGEVINPAGFAFESYDALGRWRDLDNTLPVDASGSFNFGSEKKSFNGAVEFSAAMAEQGGAHHCYAGNWLEFLYGRSMTVSDQALIGRVADGSQQSTLTIRDLVRELVLSPSFRTRPL